MCVFKLNTELGYHVNLSVVNMTHKGENNTPACEFAGLSAFDSDMEISTLCVKPDFNFDILKMPHYGTNNLYSFPNIYSANSNMTLVLYSFEAYAHAKVTFMISTTTCTPMRKQICESTAIELLEEKGQCTVLQIIFSGGHLGKDVSDRLFRYFRQIRKCKMRTQFHTRNNSEDNMEFLVTGFFRGEGCGKQDFLVLVFVNKMFVEFSSRNCW